MKVLLRALAKLLLWFTRLLLFAGLVIAEYSLLAALEFVRILKGKVTPK